MAGGHFGGRDTCESCKSIDVRHWYREGRLADGQYFTWSWTCLGETSGTIEVRTECDAAVLRYRARGFSSRRVEVHRTARADYMDELPPWWPPALVRLFRPCQRPVLWAARRDASGKAPSVDAATTSSTPSTRPEDRAERRQVTVMFSDLVGSTALSARMDPEDLREIISAYQKRVATVQRFGGFVAKYMGDEVCI